jgi:hypothetical protein
MDDTTRRDEEADAIGFFVDERPATATREAGGVSRSLIAPACSSALMRADTAAGTVGFEVQKNFCTAIEIRRAIAAPILSRLFLVIWMNQPKTPSMHSARKAFEQRRPTRGR